MKCIDKITDWYFTKRALPYWWVLVLDCLIVLGTGMIGCYLEIGGCNMMQYFWKIVGGLGICIPFYIFSFHQFHTYQGVIRYSGAVDFLRIMKATLLGSTMMYAFSYFMMHVVELHVLAFPNFGSVIEIFVISTMLIWLVRMAVKSSYEAFASDSAIPVAIYGTKSGGMSIANSIRSVKDKKYVLRAFVSDSENMKSARIFGQKVFINHEGVVDKLVACGVKALLVSPLKSADFRNNQQFIDALVEAGIKIQMFSAEHEWDGKSELNGGMLKEVDIEDLLPRDKIEVDMKAIGEMLIGKRILITGAAGSIGSEMARQVASFLPVELILVDQAETPMHDVRLWMKQNASDNAHVHTIVGSITNEEQMEFIFREHRPEYVFHAAAYKHVPMMENNPAMAVQNNIYGTRVIADLAVKYGTKKFVMISTDKAVNPTNVMGCSKRICEIYCQALNQKLWEETQKSGKTTTQFITTRFGNVLGSNGSVIPIFKEQIKKGGSVKVTHPDIIRFFMLIPEACRLVLEAGTMGNGGEIFVFDMGKPVKIVDLAKRMIKLSGTQNVKIEFTGLRDGEKLYEEVLNDAEATKPTRHPKIKIAAVREYPYELARQNEIELMELSKSFGDMKIVKKMKQIVPEYKSKVSKYEVLDK